MSDDMLIAVLRMPPCLWDNGPIDVRQRYERYMEAADLIEKLQERIEALKMLLEEK